MRTQPAVASRCIEVLSNDGREFCGRLDRHPYELFLLLEDVEHRTTKVNRPQSNGKGPGHHRPKSSSSRTVRAWRSARHCSGETPRMSASMAYISAIRRSPSAATGEWSRLSRPRGIYAWRVPLKIESPLIPLHPGPQRTVRQAYR